MQLLTGILSRIAWKSSINMPYVTCCLGLVLAHGRLVISGLPRVCTNHSSGRTSEHSPLPALLKLLLPLESWPSQRSLVNLMPWKFCRRTPGGVHVDVVFWSFDMPRASMGFECNETSSSSANSNWSVEASFDSWSWSFGYFRPRHFMRKHIDEVFRL